MFTAGRARILYRAVALVAAMTAPMLVPTGGAQAAGPAALGGGSGVYVEDLTTKDQVSECTLTAIGYDRENRLVAITAGHCGEVGARLLAEKSTKSGVIGVISEKSDDNDWAVIELNADRVAPVRKVAQSVINGIGSNPRVGDTVCKNGRTTGYTCGLVWESNPEYFRSQVCANHGDSGGPVLIGDRLVGMVVAATNFTAGPINIELPLCKGAGDIIHEPELATSITMVLADIDAHGKVGAGFRVF